MCEGRGGGYGYLGYYITRYVCMQSSHDCVVKKYKYQVSMCMCRAMANYGYHGYQHVFVLNLRLNVCMCGGCVYYGYHGYQHVFVLNLNISAVHSRVPTGTKSQCVCAWPWQIMGTTGTNTFLYKISD